MTAVQTVLTVAAALVAASLPVFLLSALAPSIQLELGFGEAGLGVAVAAFFLAAAVSSVPGGRFADRFGAPVALRTGLGIAATGSLGVAMLAGSGRSLAAAMFLGGTALGFVDTGGARAIAAAVPPTRQGFAFGTKEASIPAASFLAGASVPLLGERLGWRPAFGVGLAFAVVVAALVSRHLEQGGPAERSEADARSEAAPGSVHHAECAHDHADAGSEHHAERDLTDLTDPTAPAEATAATAPPGQPVPSHREGQRVTGDGPGSPGQGAGAAAARDQSATTVWPLLLLSVTAALGGGAAAATTAFLVASSVAHGLRPGTAGGLLAGASAVAIAARLLVGAVADRRASSAVPLVAAMLGAGSLGVAGLTLATATGATSEPAGVGLTMTSAVLAIGAGWGWTGLVFLAAVRLDADRPAKAAGIVLAGLGIGGATGPALFGGVAGRVGYSVAWAIAACALLVAVATALTADRLARGR